MLQEIALKSASTFLLFNIIESETCLSAHNKRKTCHEAKLTNRLVGESNWNRLHPEAQSVAIDIAFDRGCENVSSEQFKPVINHF